MQQQMQTKSFQEIVNTLRENQGSFSANTNSYYTVARVTNEKGLTVPSKDGSERQFRMKLPETSLCAFLAVGWRLVFYNTLLLNEYIILNCKRGHYGVIIESLPPKNKNR